MDWAGIAAERATGKKLNDLIQENICQPLNLTSVTMFPSAELKKNLAAMHQRSPDGTVSERDHLLRRNLMALTPDQQSQIFNSGGAGCFAKPTEYIRTPRLPQSLPS